MNRGTARRRRHTSGSPRSNGDTSAAACAGNRWDVRWVGPNADGRGTSDCRGRDERGRRRADARRPAEPTRTVNPSERVESVEINPSRRLSPARFRQMTAPRGTGVGAAVTRSPSPMTLTCRRISLGRQGVEQQAPGRVGRHARRARRVRSFAALDVPAVVAGAPATRRRWSGPPRSNCTRVPRWRRDRGVRHRQGAHRDVEQRCHPSRFQQSQRRADRIANLHLVMPALGVFAPRVHPVLGLGFTGPAHRPDRAAVEAADFRHERVHPAAGHLEQIDEQPRAQALGELRRPPH